MQWLLEKTRFQALISNVMQYQYAGAAVRQAIHYGQNIRTGTSFDSVLTQGLHIGLQVTFLSIITEKGRT